jgi:hypothetical protein
MSFLDLQDLATVAAQADVGRLIIAWCAESEAVTGAIEGAVAACLVGFLLKLRISAKR